MYVKQCVDLCRSDECVWNETCYGACYELKFCFSYRKLKISVLVYIVTLQSRLSLTDIHSIRLFLYLAVFLLYFLISVFKSTFTSIRHLFFYFFKFQNVVLSFYLLSRMNKINCCHGNMCKTRALVGVPVQIPSII